MSDRIHVRIHQLPERSVTTVALHALDFVVPGEWTNITDFRQLVHEVTGATDEELQNAIARTAISLYDEDDSYQTAMQIFELVDSVDQLASAMAAANKFGENFDFAGILEEYTPKADTVQAIDAGLKLIAEVVAYFYLHGWPDDGVMGFVDQLADYGAAEKMRLVAWITFDGLVPLGPDFLQLITEALDEWTSDEMGNNKMYQAIEAYIPGDGDGEKLGFIQEALAAAQTWITDFVEENDITQEKVVAQVQDVLSSADNGLDFLAAALDATTNYYEHTGTQTVARTVIWRAWQDYDYSEYTNPEEEYTEEYVEEYAEEDYSEEYSDDSDDEDPMAAAIAAAEAAAAMADEDY